MRLGFLIACCGLPTWAWAAESGQTAIADAGVEHAGTGPGPVQGSVGDPAYRVGPRDLLRVDVYGEADLTGTWPVGSGGTIDYPLIGRIDVGGLTTSEIAERIGGALAERFLVDPQVNVRIDTYASQAVKVIGAVQNPGVYYLTGPTTLVEILARAGDVDNDKGIREVRIERQGQAPQVVAMDELVGKGDVTVASGDTIYVPEGLYVYIAGDVNTPGEIAYAEGMTVTQALTKAGGPKPTANLKEAYVLRSGERVQVHLRSIMHGHEPDVVLRPGDQLFIQESVF